jgi:3-dehydrosphinganine reductase
MILALLVVTLGVSFLALRRRKKPDFIASFAGKHVLITGASSGIGLALSKKSLEEGAFVTLVARNSAKLEQAAGSLLKDLQCSPDRILTKVPPKKLNPTSSRQQQLQGLLMSRMKCGPIRPALTDPLQSFFSQVADVGDYASIARVMEEALAWRPIDVLMCNAGVTRTGFFEDVKLKDINSIVQTNLLGAIYTVHASLPSLKQHSRAHPVSIVFIASLASLVSMKESIVMLLQAASCLALTDTSTHHDVLP